MTTVLDRPTRPIPRAATLARRLRESVLIGLLALAVYLVPAWRVVQLNPDVVEYIDVARRLVAGEGFQLGVKAYHIGGTDVLHDALDERPPLYPVLAAAILGLGFDLRALQVANAVLAATAVILVAEVGRALFGRAVGIAGGILAGASPVVLARMIPPMTEALTIVLLLTAVWLLVRRSDRPHRREYALAGLALGLGYLARPTTAAIVVALMVLLPLTYGWRRGVRGAGWLLAGAAVFIVPMSLYSLSARGSLSYSGQAYLYAVHKDSDVLRNGFGRPLPTALEFIGQSSDFVVVAILENIRDYAALLLTDREWLWPLWPAWIGVGLLLAARALPRRALIPAGVALAGFSMYAITWANFQERYQLPTLLLLLPFLAAGVQALVTALLGLARRPVGPVLAAVPVMIAIGLVAWSWSPAFRDQYRDQFRYGDERVKPRTDAGLRWTGPPRWVEDPELPRVSEWIRAETAPGDALTHGQPWPYTFFTSRPATLLPTKLDGERLRSFLASYRVAYVLLDERDRDRRGYRADLDALGLPVVGTPGSVRIYDARPLWAPSR